MSDRIAAVEARHPHRPRYDFSRVPRDVLEMIASLPDDGDMSGLTDAERTMIEEALRDA